MGRGGSAGEWTVLIPRLPSEPSRHRVAVWRELRRCGAVQLGQGVWTLPEVPSFADQINELVALVARNGGEVMLLRSQPGDERTATRVRGLYDEARRAEWAEFTAECDKCRAELAHEIETRKFTLAELDEEEQNVERLRRWHRELRARDVFDAGATGDTQSRLDACNEALEQFTGLVYDAVGLT